MKKILIICGCVILAMCIALLCYMHFPWIILPVDLAPYRGMVLEFETSTHLTVDGYQIIITYLWEAADQFVVADVEIKKAEKDWLYQQLLPMDRPEKLLETR